MSASGVLGQIDGLLLGTVPRMRAPAMTFATMHATVEEPGQEFDHNADPAASIRFLTRWAGDGGGWQGTVSGPDTQRLGKIEIDLAIYSGGEMTVDWFKAQALRLADAYGQARSLLEDPNNRAWATTGWVLARNFSCSPPEVQSDRLVATMTFEALFLESVGPM
jgi:hypothetical protein